MGAQTWDDVKESFGAILVGGMLGAPLGFAVFYGWMAAFAA